MASSRGVPKLSHHKPSGRAVVRLSGKDHYCGAWDKTKGRPTAQATARYRQLISEWMAGLDQPREAGTIVEMVAAYWGHVQRTYRKNGKPTSEVTAQKTAMKYLLAYADLPIEEFGPLKLKAVRQRMVDDNLVRRSINRHVRRIRQAFGWAAENELIDPVHPERLKCVKGLRKGRGGRESKPKQPVAWDLVEPIREHVAPTVWAMVQLQWHTGMRPGEVVQLRGADLETGGEVWVYTPAEHKTEHHDKERLIAIGPQAQEILRPWLRANRAEYIFRPADAEDHRNTRKRARRMTPRWASHATEHRRKQRGQKRRRFRERYTEGNYRQAIVRAIERAAVAAWEADRGRDAHLRSSYRKFLASGDDGRRKNVEIRAWLRSHGGAGSQYTDGFRAFWQARKWHPHQLRHAFATRARAAFENWDPVRAALGHSSPETTLEYARLERRKAEQVARKIG